MIGVKRQPGYSLIELLVVTLIFSMMLVVLSQIFVSFSTLHRKVANTSLVSEDMRFVMELLTREIRNDEIDYTAYGGSAPNVGNIIRLRKQNGTNIWISQRSNPQSGCDYTLTDSCLAMSQDSGTTWTQITSGRISIQNFGVFIQPAASPFVQSGATYPSNTQPLVTIHLNMVYRAERVKEQVSLRAQTSVSSRVYRR